MAFKNYWGCQIIFFEKYLDSNYTEIEIPLNFCCMYLLIIIILEPRTSLHQHQTKKINILLNTSNDYKTIEIK